MQLLEREADWVHCWSNGPAFVYAPHSHSYRKILYVVEGSITFTPVGREQIEMAAGDRLELAPGTVHGAIVGDSGVTCCEGQARAS